MLDLYNGKQLAELKEQEIRQIAAQAKVYHDKMYDPADAASRLIAALAAVKAGNDAELYNVISGKFPAETSAQNSSDFSVLVQSVSDDDDNDDEYEQGRCFFRPLAIVVVVNAFTLHSRVSKAF